MNFCKDCRYALGSLGELARLKCGHPKNSVEHIDAAMYAVTGILQSTVSATLSASCLPLRQMKTHPGLGIELCGLDGIWFEKLRG